MDPASGARMPLLPIWGPLGHAVRAVATLDPASGLLEPDELSLFV